MPGIPMPTNPETEHSLRIALKAEGFRLSRQRKKGETGVDVIAERRGEKYYIEVIGFKRRGPSRTGDFCQAFFQSIARLDLGAKHCIMALPQRMGVGIPMRAKQYKIAWYRIGIAFPELEIWLVNTQKNELTRTSWESWLKTQH